MCDSATGDKVNEPIRGIASSNQAFHSCFASLFPLPVHPTCQLHDDAINSQLGPDFVEPASAIGAIALGVQMELHFHGAVAIFGDPNRFEKRLGEVA